MQVLVLGLVSWRDILHKFWSSKGKISVMSTATCRSACSSSVELFGSALDPVKVYRMTKKKFCVSTVVVVTLK